MANGASEEKEMKNSLQSMAHKLKPLLRLVILQSISNLNLLFMGGMVKLENAIHMAMIHSRRMDELQLILH